MLRDSARRRPISLLLVLVGGALAWAATPGLIGLLVLGLGGLLEGAGVVLEHRARR